MNVIDTLRHKRSLILAMIVGGSLALSPLTVWAEESSNPLVTKVDDSKNQILKLTDHGLEPSEVHMKKDDVILFFLNESKDSLATLEIEYGKQTMHCSGGNLLAQGTSIRSTRPFGPGDFASVCFHDPGVYPLKVFGLKQNPMGIETKVYVE